MSSFYTGGSKAIGTLSLSQEGEGTSDLSYSIDIVALGRMEREPILEPNPYLNVNKPIEVQVGRLRRVEFREIAGWGWKSSPIGLLECHQGGNLSDIALARFIQLAKIKKSLSEYFSFRDFSLQVEENGMVVGITVSYQKIDPFASPSSVYDSFRWHAGLRPPY